MPTCNRPGCGVEFDPASPTPCAYHPGAPVFHEGLKSWSCCKDINKPVTEFDDFVKFKGCTTGEHTSEKLQAPKPAIAPESCLNNFASSAAATSATVTSTPTPPIPQSDIPPEPERNPTTKEKPSELQEDPSGVEIPVGSRCKRSACSVVYAAGMPRTDDECCHHPGQSIFHEGSKGYTCCKRRALEFDEFLNLEGCTKGRHLFIGSNSTQSDSPKLRIDHYQTQTTVIVSVFGKGADKEKSSVRFEPWDLHIELHLKNNQIYQNTIPLYGPIDPEASSFQMFGTKCEITLKKADGRPWASLEASNLQTTLTFGVQADSAGTA